MTLNSRILALLTLVFVITGCVQVTTAPEATGPSPSAPTAQVSDTQSPEVVTNENMVDKTEQDAPRPVLVESKVETKVELIAEPIAELIVEPDASSETEVAISPEEAPGFESESVSTETSTEAARDTVAMTESPEQPGPEELPQPVALQPELMSRQVNALCNEIGNKLGSVSVEDCLSHSLASSGGYTVQGRPMVIRDFHADDAQDEKARILILGGIHGDEYSSISIMFKWMEILRQSNNDDFEWRFVPTVNPDGLLDGQAVRQNANGVDLNRNFPSEDWQDLAEEYWNNSTSRNPRRYPGTHPASEPEVQWVVSQIKAYKPDVIVSVHAPYHLLDYDGPPEAPQQIGELHLHLLGVYPGSLGNYAGINLGIPVVTMELPSAGIMPSTEEISSMWKDLLDWLYEHHES